MSYPTRVPASVNVSVAHHPVQIRDRQDQRPYHPCVRTRDDALGLLIDRLGRVLRRLTHYLHAIEVVTGLFLILLGGLLISGELATLIMRLSGSLTTFDEGISLAGGPVLFIVMLGGLLSFLSPCVLPLVPAYIGYLGGHVVGQAAIEARGVK